MRFVDPKSNIAFKKIFGNQTHKDILISFLNAVLALSGSKQIQDVTILDSYQAPRLEDLKETILDVQAVNAEGVTFIVEMQVEKQAYFDKRALYYSSKAYVGQIQTGDDYPKLNQVIFIGILDFSIFSSSDYISRHLILNAKTHQQEMKDFEFNFIELPKFTKSENELQTILEKWVYFLKYAKKATIIPPQLKDTQEIVDAFTVAAQHNWTQHELDVYDYWQMQETGHRLALELAEKEARERGWQDGRETGRQEGRETGRREGREEGRQEGIEEGIEQGIEQGRTEGELHAKYEIAKNLLKSGISIEMLCQVTGLSAENVQQLSQK
ncbi:hypothetical protein U14_02897 [Candidatus Moduliflexus flocculans]|uniref:Transposase n=1 Tax=Candidatus Moduliflexus flocculans TaxID=1499966 RepID=A0A081BMN6_9BACT|nr:hypothetical protein U14_02897 [Candidatus Moduliflexus flocculans]